LEERRIRTRTWVLDAAIQIQNILFVSKKKNKLAGVRPEREIITMHAKAEVTAVLKFNLVFSYILSKVFGRARFKVVLNLCISKKRADFLEIYLEPICIP